MWKRSVVQCSWMAPLWLAWVLLTPTGHAWSGLLAAGLVAVTMWWTVRWIQREPAQAFSQMLVAIEAERGPAGPRPRAVRETLAPLAPR